MESAYMDLAQRLKCAYVSHRLNISLSYCMKTYIADEPIDDYFYELAQQFYREDMKLSEQKDQVSHIGAFHIYLFC